MTTQIQDPAYRAAHQVLQKDPRLFPVTTRNFTEIPVKDCRYTNVPKGREFVMISINLLSQKCGNLRPVLGNAGKITSMRTAIAGIRYAFGTVKSRAPGYEKLTTIKQWDSFEVRTSLGKELVGTVRLESEEHTYIDHLGHERIFRRPLDENGTPIDINGGAEYHIFKLIPQIGSIVIPKPSGECRRKIWGVVYDFGSYLHFARKLHNNDGLTLQIIPLYSKSEIEIREKISGRLMDTIKLKDARTPLDNEGNPIKITYSGQSVSVLGSIIRKALPETQGQAGIHGIRYCNIPKNSFIIKYSDRLEIRNIEDNSLLGTVRLEKKDHKQINGNLMQRLEEIIKRKEEADPEAKQYSAMFVLDVSGKSCRVVGIEDKHFYHDDIARESGLSKEYHARNCINGLYVQGKGLALYRPNFRKIEIQKVPELFERVAQLLIKEGMDPKMSVAITRVTKGLTSLEELADRKMILEQEKRWYSIIAAICVVLGDRIYGSFRKLAMKQISPIEFLGKSFDFFANILKWFMKK